MKIERMEKMFAMLAILVMSENVAAVNMTAGDVNEDGTVNIADALLVAQYVAGIRNLTSNQLLLADVNGDNIVNMTDAVSIARYAVGLDDFDNIDTTSPGEVSNLKNVSYAQNYINWTWNDPSDADFSKVMIYINGKFKTNVAKGKQYYNSIGLSSGTIYNISTRTVDSNGNIDSTWVNDSEETYIDITPPSSISNLRNIDTGTNYINWAWNDPSDVDFSKVMIYINGKFKTNVAKGKQHYNSIGLSSGTIYNISTRTVDSNGNIDPTWVNDSEETYIDITPPSSISNLRNIDTGTNYINWAWNDPSDADFSKVMIYINGKFKTNVTKGKQYYNSIGLSSGTIYNISTRTVDSNGNIDPTWVNDSEETTPEIIRFITIGDVHIISSVNKSDANSNYQRFNQAVNYINNRTDVDFVVQLGDITDSASNAEFDMAKSVMNNLTKPYYVVEGNHDMGFPQGSSFMAHFGPAEHIENINGYQLIFVGINRNGTKDANNTTREYDWSFGYSSADKNKPTIIFAHGPVQPKPGGTCENWDGNVNWNSNISKEIYFSYACGMKIETDQFTNLLGYYAGHVHVGTDETIGNALYVTEDNLGGYGQASDYIGYTEIRNGIVNYNTVYYR